VHDPIIEFATKKQMFKNFVVYIENGNFEHFFDKKNTITFCET